MRTTILSTALGLMTSVTALAQSPNESTTAHDHLLAVNPLWSAYEVDNEEGLSFKNEDDRISYHLLKVIDMLRERTTECTPATERRLALLDDLEIYSREKRFPINTHHDLRIPYFIDDHGTACAVGHLMRSSGNGSLAEQISMEHNYDRLADITTKGIPDWASTYGFSLDELALIQPAYPPANSMNTIGQGVNGPVYEIFTRPSWTRLYITGDFDMMDGAVSCSTGFGYIESGQYHCLPNAPTGPVMHMAHANQGADLMVAGQFDHEGATYPLAIYDGENWTYKGIPDHPAALGKVARSNYSAFSSLILAISPSGVSGADEIWRLDATDGDQWVKVLTVDGSINCAEPGQGLYFGGSFDHVIDHAQGDLEMEADGLFQLTSSQWSGDAIVPMVSDNLPGEIQDIERFGSLVYVAGTNDGDPPNTYLTRIENGFFLPQLYVDEWGGGTMYSYLAGEGIHDMQILANGDVMIGGELSMSSFTVYGENLGIYHPNSGLLDPLAVLQEPVHSLALVGGATVFAGEFAEEFPPGLDHIGITGTVTAVEDLEHEALSLYPNPVDREFTVDIDARSVQRAIARDMTGREHAVRYRGQGASLKVDADALVSGIYLLTIHTDEGVFSARFVKE